jgi:limonene-1,2-epoxide hydrolase
MNEDNIKIVEAYLNALKNKDFAAAPISDDLYFEDPMMGEGKGAEAMRAFVSGFFPALDDLRILQHVSEGEYVVTRWEVEGVFGTIPVLEIFRIRDGKIIEFRSFYDPRPIMG